MACLESGVGENNSPSPPKINRGERILGHEKGPEAGERLVKVIWRREVFSSLCLPRRLWSPGKQNGRQDVMPSLQAWRLVTGRRVARHGPFGETKACRAEGFPQNE